MDRHECPDMVKYHKAFLAKIAENKHLKNQYDDTTLDVIAPSLPEGQQKHVPIHHNKSIFQLNKLQQKVWMKNGKMPLRKKGQGKAIHVSDFITKELGWLSLSEVQVNNFQCSHL